MKPTNLQTYKPTNLQTYKPLLCLFLSLTLVQFSIQTFANGVAGEDKVVCEGSGVELAADNSLCTFLWSPYESMSNATIFKD